MQHLGTKKLETNRLILRPFQITDYMMMFNNWANDDEVVKYLTWPKHTSLDVTKELLKRWISFYSDNKFYQWGIVLKDTNELVGSISSVMIIDSLETIEIGYCLGQKYWQKGIMSEAFNRIIAFFFENVGAKVIRATYDTRNIASKKVMEKCNLKYEGTKRLAALSNVGFGDLGIYSILNHEYLGGCYGQNN